MAVEKYILTRSMHLGHLKDTFGKGAVIAYDDERRQLNIDGRKFDDVRDIEILKRQAITKPHDPWIVPFSQELLNEIRGVGATSAAPPVARRSKPGEGMKIVQDDSDVIEPIDIRRTQVGKRNAEKKAADRQRIKSTDLEVIQGDETVEERIARLKTAKNTDLAARAERIRLMRERVAKVPIVKDDSLGSGVSSKAMAMNAGTPVGGRRAEETPEEVRALAEARRREADMKRKQVAEDVGFDPGSIEVGPMPAEGEDDASVAVPEVDPKDAEIAALKARLAALEKGVRKPVLHKPKTAKKVVA